MEMELISYFCKGRDDDRWVVTREVRFCFVFFSFPFFL